MLFSRLIRLHVLCIALTTAFLIYLEYYFYIIPLFQSEILEELRQNATRVVIPIQYTLPSAVRTFLTAANESGLVVVVLQPMLLLPLLSEKDLQLLEKRNITPFANERRNVVTFGMLSLKNGNTTSILRSLGFVSHNELPLGNRQKRVDSQHYFSLHENLLIHFVILMERSNFLYLEPVKYLPPEISAKFAIDDLFIGNFAIALERFWIEHVSVSSSISLPIPQPLVTFIVYLKWSRFLECNHNVSEGYRRKYSFINNKNLEMSFKLAVPRLKFIFDTLASPFWLASGTLLGWYRNCGITPHTTDIDFAAYIRNDPDQIFHVVNNTDKWKVRYVYGYPERAFEFTVRNRYGSIDVFFVHEEQDIQWYAIHENTPTRSYTQLVFTKHLLCSAELLGLKVLVPCTPETVITEEYGENWTIPVVKWKYAMSSKNMKKRFTWTPEEQKKFLRNV